MKFKKVLAAILTTLTAACLAVGFSGCDKNLSFKTKISETTAENPYYDLQFENLSVQAEYNHYKEFYNYIKGEFEQVNSNAYVYIEPYAIFEDDIEERIYGWSFSVCSDNSRSTENIFVIENFKFYDEELGGWVKDFYGDGEIPSGVVDYSVGLTFVFPTLGIKTQGNEVVLEFGDYSSSEWIYEHFINLYIGEICIGTCFYEEGVEVPQSWFADYFANKLKLVNE